MLINTKFLGNLEIEEKNIVVFDNGMPGFNELHKFIMLSMEENPDLKYMQSLEAPEVCFIVVNPFLILGDYEADLSEETVQALEASKAEDISLYSILTIPEALEDITVNLAAPIVINNANNKAAQEILNNDKYSIKHKLFRGE